VNETTNYKNTVDVTIDILVRVLYILAFPTIALTENSKHKWVRALGQTGTVIPMLPWTLLVLICAFIITTIGETIYNILKGWEKV